MYESTPDYCRISLLHATAHRSFKQHLPFSPEMVTFSDPIVSHLFQVIHSVSTFLSRRIGYRKWHPPKNFQAPSTSPILELHPSQLSLAFALLSCVNPSSILSYNHPAPSGFTTTPLHCVCNHQTFSSGNHTLALSSCIYPRRSSELHPNPHALVTHSGRIRLIAHFELHPPCSLFRAAPTLMLF